MARQEQTRPAERHPLRLLVVRTGAMGDVLHGLPAVSALRRRLPQASIGWAIEPAWRALLESGGPDQAGKADAVIDRIHSVPTRAWRQRPFSIETLGEIASLRRELRAQRYDVCVDLQGSIRSAVIARLSGARDCVGSDAPREAAARFFYRQRVRLQAGSVIAQACELAGAAASEDDLQPAQVCLPTDREAEARVDRRLAGAAPFVLLVPAAGWGAKQWPHFRELARRLSESGLRVLVNAASGDEELACRVATGGHGEVFPCSLAELIALTRRAALVVGGDTGPVHLAAALGRRTVALFGPTDPARNGPFFPGAQMRVLRDEASLTDHRRFQETEPGLAQMTVEAVYSACMDLLEERTHG